MSSGLTFTFNFAKHRPTARLIDAVRLKGENPAEILEAVGEHAKTIAGRSIRESADPVSGSRWPPNRPLTMALRPGGGGGGKPLADTGRLLQSLVAARPIVTGNRVVIGTNLPHAGILQYGGTIRPKRGKYLWMPLTRDAKRTAIGPGGVRRWFEKNEKKKPFILKRAGRSPVVVTRRSRKYKGRTLDAHFVLKDKVDMPARPYLGWGDRDKATVMGIISKHFTNIDLD